MLCSSKWRETAVKDFGTPAELSSRSHYLGCTPVVAAPQPAFLLPPWTRPIPAHRVVLRGHPSYPGYRTGVIFAGGEWQTCHSGWCKSNLDPNPIPETILGAPTSIAFSDDRATAGIRWPQDETTLEHEQSGGVLSKWSAPITLWDRAPDPGQNSDRSTRSHPSPDTPRRKP